MKTLKNNKHINSGVGLVLEIDVNSLPRDTRMALTQIWEFPEVFPVAKFSAKLQRMLKLYSLGELDPLKQIDTAGFEYVSFVKTIDTTVRERVVVAAGRARPIDRVCETIESCLKGEKISKSDLAKTEKALGELTRLVYINNALNCNAAAAGAGKG